MFSCRISLRIYYEKILLLKSAIFRGDYRRCWDFLCAVSSDAVIDRKSMPREISDKLVKTEFLVDKLTDIMRLKNKFMRIVNVTDTRPDFTQKELNSVGEFIIAQHIDPNQTANQAAPQVAQVAQVAQTPKIQESIPQFEVQPQATNTTQTVHTAPNAATSAANAILSCKHCGESTHYSPMYGKYGYYITCKQCSKNTPMKQACPQCHSPKTKVSKRKETYTLNCQDCNHENQLV
jgi:hypothetical protein